jgi:hypothetical protein
MTPWERLIKVFLSAYPNQDIHWVIARELFIRTPNNVIDELIERTEKKAVLNVKIIPNRRSG